MGTSTRLSRRLSPLLEVNKPTCARAAAQWLQLFTKEGWKLPADRPIVSLIKGDSRAQNCLTKTVMHGQFNLWKAAIGVLIYVIVCMVILCFAPPDYASPAASRGWERASAVTSLH